MIPDQARTADTEDFLLVRYPDWIHHQLELVRFAPVGDFVDAIDVAIATARTFEVPELVAWARLGVPDGLVGLYETRGGVVDETIDVLAPDLAHGRTGPTSVRSLSASSCGGSTARVCATSPGSAWRSSPTTGDRPVGSGGVSVEDGDVRLWGGGVLEDARGRGVYRALLAEHLAEGVRQDADLAIVKGRVQTSGPILRRAGFHAFGREVSCTIVL